jgi:hypothetical protein
MKLQYVRKISCKSELFWLSGSLEDSEITPHYFCDYIPFEEDLVLYLINLNSLYTRIICRNFD